MRQVRQNLAPLRVIHRKDLFKPPQQLQNAFLRAIRGKVFQPNGQDPLFKAGEMKQGEREIGIGFDERPEARRIEFQRFGRLNGCSGRKTRQPIECRAFTAYGIGPHILEYKFGTVGPENRDLNEARDNEIEAC